MLISGSWDSTIKVWKLPPLQAEPSSSLSARLKRHIAAPQGKCVATLEGDAANVVYCQQWEVKRQRVTAGTRRAVIQVWDLTSERMSCTYMGHTKQVYCLQRDDTKIVSGSGDHSIKVWDPKSGRCEATLTGHLNPVMSLHCNEDLIVSGGYDKNIKIWDLRTGRMLNTLQGHSSAVFAVQFDYDKIVSGSADTSLKLWDFNKQYYDYM
jgi:WD40 repeat protein